MQRTAPRPASFAALTAVFSFFAFSPSFARAGRAPVSALTDPFGTTAALSGGGTAVVGDLSAADANPAGLALSKEISIMGEARWRDVNIRAVEAGVHDSLMSEVSAGLKARLSTRASGAKDRRFTLGLAERMGDGPLVIGIGGDYIQVQRSKAETDAGKSKYIDTPRLRAGIVYNLSEFFLFGLRTDGWLDHVRKETSNAVGLAFGFAGYYVLNGDLIFRDVKMNKTTVGITVLPKAYLDLRLSYGYGIESKLNSGAVGVALKSDAFRLYYTLAKPVLREKPIDHSIGAGFIITM